MNLPDNVISCIKLINKARTISETAILEVCGKQYREESIHYDYVLDILAAIREILLGENEDGT